VFEDIPKSTPEPDLINDEKRGPETVTLVTMRQARLALLSAGLLDDVDTTIASITDLTVRKAAQIEWEYSTTVSRNGELLKQLAPGLGLNDTQLDALFTAAAKL
jgi:hypothetical protein